MDNETVIKQQYASKTASKAYGWSTYIFGALFLVVGCVMFIIFYHPKGSDPPPAPTGPTPQPLIRIPGCNSKSGPNCCCKSPECKLPICFDGTGKKCNSFAKCGCQYSCSSRITMLSGCWRILSKWNMRTDTRTRTRSTTTRTRSTTTGSIAL